LRLLCISQLHDVASETLEDENGLALRYVEAYPDDINISDAPLDVWVEPALTMGGGDMKLKEQGLVERCGSSRSRQTAMGTIPVVS
jgi:hypothetical protein